MCRMGPLLSPPYEPSLSRFEWHLSLRQGSGWSSATGTYTATKRHLGPSPSMLAWSEAVWYPSRHCRRSSFLCQEIGIGLLVGWCRRQGRSMASAADLRLRRLPGCLPPSRDYNGFVCHVTYTSRGMLGTLPKFAACSGRTIGQPRQRSAWALAVSLTPARAFCWSEPHLHGKATRVEVEGEHHHLCLRRTVLTAETVPPSPASPRHPAPVHLVHAPELERHR